MSLGIHNEAMIQQDGQLPVISRILVPLTRAYNPSYPFILLLSGEL